MALLNMVILPETLKKTIYYFLVKLIRYSKITILSIFTEISNISK